MKKFLTILLSLCVSASFFAACNGENEKNDSGCKVIISESAVSMDVYEYKILTAKIFDKEGNMLEGTVEWNTSDSAIASVSGGKIFAKGVGVANISASYSGVKAECSVTVIHNGNVPRLVLGETSIEIAKGETFTLKPKVFFKGTDATDEDTVFMYAVNKESVVSVDASGVIGALETGNAQITITAFWRGIGGENMIGSEDALGLKVNLSVVVK